MGDLKNPILIWIKGLLFLCLGVFAGTLLIILTKSWLVAALFLICVWSFCRTYYFAFYVIEHYVDANYKFAGLFDFVKYALSASKNHDD